jgi:DnaJ-domain-containing protein 1
VVISTNLKSCIDPRPVGDPGVVVYWNEKLATRCMAIDRYARVAGNLGAIAATLMAMRAIERHGGAEVRNKAFAGFAALPAPKEAWEVLGLNSAQASPAEIEDAYRRLAMRHHPDKGGTVEQMARINAARDKLLKLKALL